MNLITPQTDGEPTPHLRTATVVTVAATWTILLDGVEVPADALAGVVALPSDVVTVLTRVNAPPLVLGTIATIGSGWHLVGGVGEPAFQNSWGNLGAGFQPVRFRRQGDEVTIEGVAAGGGLGTTVFTLPVGYRPLAIKPVANVISDVLARIDVTAAGAVTHATGGAATTYLTVNCTVYTS